MTHKLSDGTTVPDYVYERRITRGEALKAYEETGLMPKCGVYQKWEDPFSGKTLFYPEEGCVSCGCPITAIYLKDNKLSSHEEAPDISEWAAKEFGREYRDAFTTAFDTPRPNQYTRPSERRASEGYDDGQRVKDAVMKKYGVF